jgi:hypothetical protein
MVLLLALSLGPILPAQQEDGRIVDSIGSLPVYDLDALFPDWDASRTVQFKEGGKLSQFTPSGYRIDLAPRMWTTDTIERSLRDLDPTFALESVYLLPLQEGIRSADDPELFVYNVLRSISTMEGIDYYSHTRDRRRELFHESTVINNPEDQTPVEDPLVSRIPRYDQIYAFQHDSSFGKNSYSVTYRYDVGAYYLRLVNLTPVRYLGVIPVVSREAMHVYVSILATDEGLVFYGYAAVDVLTTLGMEDRLKNSFENRVEAIFNWFQDEVDARSASRRS